MQQNSNQKTEDSTKTNLSTVGLVGGLILLLLPLAPLAILIGLATAISYVASRSSRDD